MSRHKANNNGGEQVSEYLAMDENRASRLWMILFIILGAAGLTVWLLWAATVNNNRAWNRLAEYRKPIDMAALRAAAEAGDIELVVPETTEIVVSHIMEEPIDISDEMPMVIEEVIYDEITEVRAYGGAVSYGRAAAVVGRAQLSVEAAPSYNTESYDKLATSGYKSVKQDPLSTFSIDVDTAAYANIRRMITQGTKPSVDAVRIEEMINYFTYDYSEPKGKHPFSLSTEMGPCPWKADHYLVRIGLKGKSMAKRPAANLVFLLDTSGSMGSADKLPLVKQSLQKLTDKLTQNDRISIVVYAGAAGMVLPPTRADKKGVILDALENLTAGGSTNGGQGIKLAYETAKNNLIPDGINRVILATDGDFNVGVTDNSELLNLIGSYAKDNVYLSILGFGMGNYKDDRMETLSNKGNGNYAYIDTIQEAQKVLVEQMNGTLHTIAKDVKIQVEFNPAKVAGYRLIGYENRRLNNEDFNNDKKDAGEIGAGHRVTALYEIVPIWADVPDIDVDELKYQKTVRKPKKTPEVDYEIMNVKLRYKPPTSDKSILVTQGVSEGCPDIMDASSDFKFATAIAEFGLLLRDSKWKGNASYDSVKRLAKAGTRGAPDTARRKEFLKLVRKSETLVPNKVSMTQ